MVYLRHGEPVYIVQENDRLIQWISMSPVLLIDQASESEKYGFLPIGLASVDDDTTNIVGVAGIGCGG